MNVFGMPADIRSMLGESDDGGNVNELQRPTKGGMHHVSRHSGINLNDVTPVRADERAFSWNQLAAGVIGCNHVPRQYLLRERQRPVTVLQNLTASHRFQ